MCYTLPAFLVSGLLASSREKSEPRHPAQKPTHRARPRPAYTGTRHAPGGSGHDRRSIATSGGPPVPTVHLSPAAVARAGPRRAGPEKREPELLAFFQAVRGPRAPSPSCTRRGLRDEEKHSHRDLRRPRAPACGDAIMAPSPRATTDGTSGGRAGRTPCRRTVGARPWSSAIDGGARPCIERTSCMEMAAQDLTSNPTDLCLCPSVRLSLPFTVHPFLSKTTGRPIIGRALHGRSPRPDPDTEHRTFPSAVETVRHLSMGPARSIGRSALTFQLSVFETCAYIWHIFSWLCAACSALVRT